jgi:hypothetical protein
MKSIAILLSAMGITGLSLMIWLLKGVVKEVDTSRDRLDHC